MILYDVTCYLPVSVGLYLDPFSTSLKAEALRRELQKRLRLEKEERDKQEELIRQREEEEKKRQKEAQDKELQIQKEIEVRVGPSFYLFVLMH